MGMTKFPGSRPFWKVKIEIANDSTITRTTAMTFATSRVIDVFIEEGGGKSSVNY